MTAITTHVLDLTRGRPAAGVRVTLERRGPAGVWSGVGASRTDDDGRVREWGEAALSLETGTHRLVFETGEWFGSRGESSFHPRISIEFDVIDAAQHHHVPLLLAPWGYSTYRGS